MIKKKLLKEDNATAAVNAADNGRKITIDSTDVKLTDLLDELLERNLETFKSEGQRYFTSIAEIRDPSQSDDRYNIPEMLDQEVCFA